MCHKLSDPANGRVIVDARVVGDVATYHCDDGYELIGDDVQTCQLNGNWSGSLPTCEG